MIHLLLVICDSMAYIRCSMQMFSIHRAILVGTHAMDSRVSCVPFGLDCVGCFKLIAKKNGIELHCFPFWAIFLPTLKIFGQDGENMRQSINPIQYMNKSKTLKHWLFEFLFFSVFSQRKKERKKRTKQKYLINDFKTFSSKFYSNFFFTRN